MKHVTIGELAGPVLMHVLPMMFIVLGAAAVAAMIPPLVPRLVRWLRNEEPESMHAQVGHHSESHHHPAPHHSIHHDAAHHPANHAHPHGEHEHVYQL